jgi:hypothetical protein
VSSARIKRWVTRIDPGHTAPFGVAELHGVFFEPNDDRSGCRPVVGVQIPEASEALIRRGFTEARRRSARVFFVCNTAAQADAIAAIAGRELSGSHRRIALERALWAAGGSPHDRRAVHQPPARGGGLRASPLSSQGGRTTMKGGFARVPIWAASAKITPQGWQVLTAICAHVDPAGWAWPSLDRIAAMTGIERKNVPRIITELEDAGLIHRTRGTGGRGNSTRYQVVFKGPEMFSKTSSLQEDVSSENSLPPGGRLAPETSSKTPPKRPRPGRTEQLNRTDLESERARVSEGFMKARGVYPSRGDHGDPETPARREFETAVLDRGADPEAIVAGAERYAAQVARAGTPPRFVKMFATWLRDEGWNDRPCPVERRRPVAGMA